MQFLEGQHHCKWFQN